MAMHIEQGAVLPQDVEQIVLDGQKSHDDRHGVVCNYETFYLLTRDPEHAPIGVLSGYTGYGEIYVDDLWVAEGHRNQGIGRALLKAVEERFQDCGMDNINLETNAFQAVGFYKKCGFEVEFVRHNKTNPKLTKTFFIKRLVPEQLQSGEAHGSEG